MQTDDILSTALQENNYGFPPEIKQQFIHYLELLQKWNRVFNLTAIDSPRDMVYLHILDSLSIYPYLHGTRMLDVGSGGGLPGIPLALADPHKTWVLLDKSQKKTRFLVQVIAELGLKNVSVVCHRCEDFHTNACFDSIISRAFGTIDLFVKSTQHLLCPEGYFLAMKGVYPKDEMNKLSDEFKIVEVHQLMIQGLPAARHLVKIRIKR